MSSNPGSPPKKSLEEKINGFGEILQKFGLNLIQNIGEMKHQLGVLAEKVDRIENEIIDLKGIKNLLHESNRSRMGFLEESRKIKSLLAKLSLKMDDLDMNVCDKEKEIKKFETPFDVLEDLSEKLHLVDSAHELQEAIKKARENIFLLTGGHKILFEIKTWERKIKPGMDLVRENIIENIQEKIEDWKNDL